MDNLRPRKDAVVRRPAVITPEFAKAVAERQRIAAEPYEGVVTQTGRVEGLFPLKTTGVNMSALVDATDSYLRSLDGDQLEEGRFAIEDSSWRQWWNGARYWTRHGLCLEDLSNYQRECIFDILRNCLSDAGFDLFTDARHLNLTMGEIRDEQDLLNEWMYWFSIYGSPEKGGTWGWQLDGHHVNVSCAFIGDQMVLTPTFIGAEPVFAEVGKFAGTSLFRPEEANGLSMFQALTPQQKQVATIGEILPNDLIVGALRDNYELNYEGISFDQMTADQTSQALQLIGLYVNRMALPHAAVKMEEVVRHLAETHFGWIGSDEPDGVFYYRLHSPVLLIEFEHQAGVMYANDFQTRNHIHTVVRTPNGNDYGINLLRQHHDKVLHGTR